MEKKSFRDFIENQKSFPQWKSVQAVMALVSEGFTVPFMACYQRDKTGNLNESQIRQIMEAHRKYRELTDKKEIIFKHIRESGQEDKEFEKQIALCQDLFELERLYKFHRVEKKTKTTPTRKAGLNSLAQWIGDVGQGKISPETSLEVKAKEFINPKMGFVTYQEVLRAVGNVIIKRIAGQPRLYDKAKISFFQKGVLQSTVGKKVKAKSKYEAYFKYEEKLESLFSGKNLHHYLTLCRGWKEGELRVSIKNPEEEKLLEEFKNFVCPDKGALSKEFLDEACQSALGLYVTPWIVTEIHRKIKDMADRWAVDILSKKLKKLLLTGPFAGGFLLGINPCGRGRCRMSLIDGKGRFVSSTTLKTQGEKAEEKAGDLFSSLFKQIEIQAIAMGRNGDFRESEIFVRKTLKNIDKKIPVIPVGGAAATAYATSKVAAREFPDKNPAVRSAISIARRLQDPLSELVKVEPESLDLGPYQEDVSQNLLKKHLNSVIEDCVHFVGVDVNRASEHLLKYVSGVGPDMAKEIVRDREKNGLFKDRGDLARVSKWSSLSYKQAVGFLRVGQGGQSLLDSTGIHPERYRALRDMAKELGENVSALFGKGADKISGLKEKWAKLIGPLTFDFIFKELKTQGEDPRGAFKVSRFHEDVFSMEDLREKMICNGFVSNVTHFGVFVNIGAGQDGLVHISEILGGGGHHPLEKFHTGDPVSVLIKAVDREKKQITLTMKFGEKKQFHQHSSGSSKTQGKVNKKRFSKKPGAKNRKRSENKKPGGKVSKNRSGQKSPFNNPFAVLQDLKEK